MHVCRCIWIYIYIMYTYVNIYIYILKPHRIWIDSHMGYVPQYLAWRIRINIYETLYIPHYISIFWYPLIPLYIYIRNKMYHLTFQSVLHSWCIFLLVRIGVKHIQPLAALAARRNAESGRRRIAEHWSTKNGQGSNRGFSEMVISIYLYIYIYVHVHIYRHISIYVYIYQ